MAIGIPFVASDVGAVLDITPAFMKQYVVNAGNAGMFSEKLSELISKDQKEQSEFSAKLTESVMEYSVSSVVLRFRELFL